MPLELEESIKDSPRFRVALHQVESNVLDLERKLEKLVNLCDAVVEAGQVYNVASTQLVHAIQELTDSVKDAVTTKVLDQCVEGLLEMIKYRKMLLDQVERTLKAQLQEIITGDIWRLRDLRKDFERISEDLEAAVLKNGQVCRQRAQESQECSHLLVATRKCFRHLALDYILQVNAFEIQQKFKILNTVLAYLKSEHTFFHQGYDLVSDLNPMTKIICSQLDQLSLDLTQQQRVMEQKLLAAQLQDNVADLGTEYLTKTPPGIVIEGYLFMRTSRSSRSWNRHWFAVQDRQLVYYVPSKEHMVPLMDDLRLCSVRTLEEMDRRFCFEIFSVHASCILQADSEASRQAWTEAMQSTISSAYRDSHILDSRAQGSEVSAAGTEGRDPYAEGRRVLEQSLRVAGNQRCCDCGKADPRWASINLGITLCIECSGIHRGLGVHQSKVRSLTLDTWEPELLKLICALGNDTVNQIYEAETEHSGLTKPTAESSRQEKEQWIEAKYVGRKFLKKNPAAADRVPDDSAEMSGAVSPSHRLYAAAAVGDLPAMCQALALGANVNWTNSEESRTSPLIAAARRGSLTACEYLLQNGANISYRDASGQGPLHVATRAGHTGPVCLLLKRGANQYAVDERGQDPLSIAVATANADIVTLLRLARMNEEMREAEGVFSHTGDDPTFQDIFRDFSRMASDDPEKLRRGQLESSGDC